MRLSRSTLAMIFLFGLYIFLVFYKLEDVPVFWFDEGWVSSVARNWLELGHYGQLFNGQPIPAYFLNIGFPVVLPVALSYKIFGVGIWQGRLIVACYSIGALILMVYLANRLYGKKIALATLLITIFPINFILHPIEYSRFVLGEIPSNFFYLLGLAAILKFYYRPMFGVPVLAISWALGMLTKSQLIPMLAASCFLVIVFYFRKREKGVVKILTLGFGGSILLIILVNILFPIFGNQLSIETFIEFLSVTAIVFTSQARVSSLLYIFIGITTIFGLVYVIFDYFKGSWTKEASVESKLVHELLITIIGSWLVWYALLSNGWLRFLIQPFLLGNIFVAYTIVRLLERSTLQRALKQSTYLLHMKFTGENIRGLLLVFLLVFSLFSLLANSVRFLTQFNDLSNKPLKDAVNYINQNTSEDALIETYEMEMFPFLNRKYHYPEPAIIGIKRLYMGKDIGFYYDPGALDPDYIVSGSFSNDYGFYDEILGSGDYGLIKEFGPYQIYHKIDGASSR